MKANWKDDVLAESDETTVVERNHYFPPDSVNKEAAKRIKGYVAFWNGVVVKS